mmetsp:Transcript_83730/g.211091  ORF Transcript_83730/g.211091 Transcript_83730/m.211091 type:complete len:251 (+) Transcript_83730:3139-3891(+)
MRQAVLFQELQKRGWGGWQLSSVPDGVLGRLLSGGDAWRHPVVLGLLGELLAAEHGRHVVLADFHTRHLQIGVVLQRRCDDPHRGIGDVRLLALVVVELQQHIRRTPIDFLLVRLPDNLLHLPPHPRRLRRQISGLVRGRHAARQHARDPGAQLAGCALGAAEEGVHCLVNRLLERVPEAIPLTEAELLCEPKVRIRVRLVGAVFALVVRVSLVLHRAEHVLAGLGAAAGVAEAAEGLDGLLCGVRAVGI